MKVCTRCGVPKPPADFYTSGNQSWCRPCTRAYTLEWRKRNPQRRWAHTRVAAAIKDGRLIRPNVCEKCGKRTYTVAHHEHYGRPLKVKWLCDTCHAIRHVELKRSKPRAKGGRPKKPTD